MVPVIARAAHPNHYGWILQRVEVDTPSHKFKAIEVVDDTGKIHAMTGFDGWTGNAVGILIAIETPAAFRALIVPTFQYVFNQCGRGLALATVRASNVKSINLCNRIGFRETYRIPDAVAIGEDLVIFEMRRDECKYLNGLRKAA
jgi:hypothetical protein